MASKKKKGRAPTTSKIEKEVSREPTTSEIEQEPNREPTTAEIQKEIDRAPTTAKIEKEASREPGSSDIEKENTREPTTLEIEGKRQDNVDLADEAEEDQGSEGDTQGRSPAAEDDVNSSARVITNVKDPFERDAQEETPLELEADDPFGPSEAIEKLHSAAELQNSDTMAYREAQQRMGVDPDTNEILNEDGEEPVDEPPERFMQEVETQVQRAGDAKILEFAKKMGIINDKGELTTKKFAENVQEQQLAVAEDIVGAVMDSFQEGLNLGADFVGWVDDELFGESLNENDPLIQEGAKDGYFKFADTLLPSRGPGHDALRGLLGYMIPFASAMKGAKVLRTGSRVAKVAASGGIGAIVDFAFIDPNESRTSDFLAQNVPFLKPFVTAFESDEDDSRLESRLKNAAEGAIMGLGIDAAVKLGKGLFRLVKYVRAGKKLRRAMIEGIDKGVAATKKAKEITDRMWDPNRKSFSELVQDKAGKGSLSDDLPIAGAEKAKSARKINLENKKALEARGLPEPPPITSFEDAKRGVIDNETTQKAADALNVTVEEMKARKLGEGYNNAEMRAFDDVATESTKKVQKASKIASNPNSTDEEVAEAYLTWGEHGEGVVQFVGGKAETARALEAAKKGVSKITDPDGTLRMTQNILKIHGGKEAASTTMLRISKLGKGELSTLARMMAKGVDMTEALNSIRMNAMLSSPVTHAVNAVSNSAVIVSAPVERLMTRGVGVIRQSMGGAAPHVASGEATAMVVGAYGGLGDAFRAGAKAARTGKSSIGKGLKLDTVRGGVTDFTGFQDLTLLGQGLTVMKFGIKEASGRMLMASDEFFKVINKRMELHALATREMSSARKYGHLSDADKAIKYNEIIQNPMKYEETQYIETMANKFAETNTFTKNLDAKIGVPGMNIPLASVDKFIKDTPLRLFAPFFKTGGNILEFGLERTPVLNLMLKDVRADLALGGIKRDMVLGKTAFGSTVTFVGYQLHQAGMITGDGPANPKARKMMEDAGHKFNSLRIGDEHLDLEVLGPVVSKIFAGVANLAEVQSIYAGDSPQKSEAFTAAFGAMVGNYVSPEAVSRTMGEVFEAMYDPKVTAKSVFTKFPSTFVPAIVRKARQVLDPQKRVVKPSRAKKARENDFFAQNDFFQEALNRVRDSIPGLAQGLPLDKDLFGNERIFNSGWGPDMVSPMVVSKEKQGVAYKEIVRLQMAGPLRNIQAPEGQKHLLITQVPKSLSIQSQDVRLDPHQYDRYLMLAAGRDPDFAINGQSLEQALTEEINQGYPRAIQPLEGPVTDEAKKLSIKDIIHEYRVEAREQLMLEFDDLEIQADQLKLDRNIELGTELG